MHDQIFMKNCLLIQDHSKSSLPNPINHFFKKLDNIHTYNTRSQSNHHYFQIINRTDYSLKSISNRAVLDWNSLLRKLSPGIKVLNISRNQLRSYIKKCIFATYVLLGFYVQFQQQSAIVLNEFKVVIGYMLSYFSYFTYH